MTNRSARFPDFQALFERAPDLYLVLARDLRIIAVSDAYCRATLTTRERLLGQGIFEAFPDNPDDAGADGVSNLRASLERVIQFRRPDAMPIQKYDIQRPAAEGGGFEERFWRPLNTPLLDSDGNVVWIIHRVEDVTELARMRADGEAAERLFRQQRGTIEQLRQANDQLTARNEETAQLQREVLSGTAELQREIAERRHTEDELRSTTSFLNLVVENIPAMIVIKDVKEGGRFVLVNRAGEEMSGLHRVDAIGKSDYDFFPKEQADFFNARDREVMESGQLLVIPEEPIDTRHKGRRFLRTLKLPIPDEQGRPKYLLALSEDITERKQTEAALRASEAKFRSLLDASPDALIVIDERGHIQLANRQVVSMFGYLSEELVGRPLDVLLPERFRSAHAHHVKGFMAAPRVRNMGAGRDLKGRRKDGSEFPVEIALSPNRSAESLQVIAAVRDISDYRAVENQLRHAQKMEAIGSLTGGMAHDFNNLLGVIIGNLDIVSARDDVDPEIRMLAGEALEAALRGADLTQRLLAFARRQPLQPVSVDANQLVDRLGKLMARTLPENVEIVLEFAESVWPIVVDPAQLEASLLNIVNNARDAMPAGGMLTIATGNRSLDADYATLHPGVAPGDFTLIEISDSGSGIPQEILEQIFEPFFTTKEQGKGTGLGLSMVFGFMKQSGGHINVYSEVGVGTTFRLYLPRAKATTDAAAAQAAAAPERGGTETVLAVEDNAGLRRVVVRQLKELGYRILEAEDGPSALRVLEKEKVDLLFTDVVMPGGFSGYDLARAAVLRWPKLRVVLTSGFPEVKLNGNGNGNGNGGPAAGMRLLIKPYRRAELARLVREVLDAEPRDA